MKLTFKNRIPRWDEGLPLGNGLCGALVWGSSENIRVSLNRSDLWDLRISDTVSSPRFQYKEYVSLAKKGAEGEAEFNELFDAPYNLPYPTRIPAGALKLSSRPCEATFELNIDSATATIKSDIYKIQLFMGATDRLGYMLIQGNCRAELLAPPFNGDPAEEDIVVRNPLSSLSYPPCKIRENDGIMLFEQEMSCGKKYAVILGRKICETGAEYVFDILLSDGDADYLEKGIDRVKKALEVGFAAAAVPHKTWWKNYFSKSDIRLPKADAALQRLHKLNEYFLACCSQKGCPPMTLQGVWLADDGSLPPWKGDYHLDLNLQFSYAGCFPLNHVSEGESYIDFIFATRNAAKKHAEQFFGVEGYILPGVMDIEGKPMCGWGQYALSPGHQAWICLALDDYWRYTRKREKLKDIYDYLSGSGRALAALLVPSKDGKLTFPVSTSPEYFDNTWRAFLTPNSNYDQAGLLYLFSRLCDYAKLCAPEDEAYWRNILDRLAPLAVGADGFKVDADLEYNESHRHFSHLMSIYPYRITKPDAELDKIQNSILNLEKYGTGLWVGFSFTWASILYSIAGNGEGARYMLKLFAECFVSSNGFHLNGDYKKRGVSQFHYRPFTLEANMLYSAALAEMFLQSEEGKIRIFPAIPDAWKEDVGFSSLRAVGGFLVSAKYSKGKIVRLHIVNTQHDSAKIILETPEGKSEITLAHGLNKILD